MQKLLNYSDIQKKMIEDLKKRTGIKNANTLIINAIVAYHKSYFPAYASGSFIDSDESPEDRASRKANEKKLQKDAEEQAKLQPKIDMCLNTLKGEIETNENGFKFCRFTSYGRTTAEDKSQMIPIKQVDPILLDTMVFSPTREAVFKNRSDIKKLFSK